MAFLDDQISVSDSAPVELYRFVTPQTTYRRTTFMSNWTFLGQPYARVTGMRTATMTDVPGAGRDVEITIPSDDPIIRDNVTGTPPVMRTSMDVEIIRLQQLSGEATTWWAGPVRGVRVVERGRAAALRVPDGLDDALRADVPRARAQRHCGHGLYDPMCRILEAAHDHPTTVTGVSGALVTVATVDPLEIYSAGQMIYNNERRTIVTQDGLNLTLDAPFRELAAPDAVTLLAGCDHTASYCASHFANILNFGGHPGLPTVNPHVRYRVNG